MMFNLLVEDLYLNLILRTQHCLINPSPNQVCFIHISTKLLFKTYIVALEIDKKTNSPTPFRHKVDWFGLRYCLLNYV